MLSKLYDVTRSRGSRNLGDMKGQGACFREVHDGITTMALRSLGHIFGRVFGVQGAYGELVEERGTKTGVHLLLQQHPKDKLKHLNQNKTKCKQID